MMQLRWENKENNRYYMAILHFDLFNELELLCVWGGIGQATGQVRRELVNLNDGLERIEELVKIRTKRGYKLVNQYGLDSTMVNTP